MIMKPNRAIPPTIPPITSDTKEPIIVKNYIESFIIASKKSYFYLNFLKLEMVALLQ